MNKRIKKAFATILTFSLLSTSLLTGLGVSSVYAYDSQVCMQYDDGVVCASLDEGSNDFEFEVRVTNYERSGSPTLYCEMKHSSSNTRLGQDCKDEFRYTRNDGQFIIDAVLNGENGTFIYDVDDEDWDTSLDEVSGGNTNSDDVDEIEAKADDNEYDLDEWIDVDIEILEDGDTVTNFSDKVRFTVETKTSGGSWFTASTSDYDLDRTSYTFKNSDDGDVSLNDLARFSKEGEYRLKVFLDDDTNIKDYVYFDIEDGGGNSSSNNDDIDNFVVTASDDKPDEDQRVYFDVEARDDDNDTLDDYRGTIEVKVYRRSNSSSSWSNITSSSDNNSYYRISDHEYDFTSSDDGDVNDAFWIEFKSDSYDYRVFVEDEDDSNADGYEIVYLKNSSSSSNDDVDHFVVKADDTTPDEDDRVYFDIDAEDDDDDIVSDYRGTVEIKIYRRSSSSSSWSNITSSSDNNSYYRISDHEYNFTSSDDGEADNAFWVEFKSDSYEYRVEVEDENDASIDGEEIVDLNGGSSSSSDDVDNFKVVADEDEPDEDDRVYFDVEARDDDNDTVTDYTDTIEIKVYRRSSSSNSWSNITSSSDNNSYYRISDHEYDFTSSDDGDATNAFWIEFKSDNYDYRVEVEDESDSSIDGEEIVYLKGSSSTNNGDVEEFEIKSNDDNPDENETVDIAVTAVDEDGDTVDDYDGTVVLKVYRRSSSSSSWSNITSSADNNSYYKVNDHEYNFSSSDDGEVDDAFEISFKNDAYDYRLIIEDDDDGSIEGEEFIYLKTDTNEDVESFKLKASDDKVDEGDRVYLTIEALDEDGDRAEEYRGTVEFRVFRRNNNGSSYVEITSNSSSYYDIEDDDYTFTSSDDGYAYREIWIEFENDSYDYKVEVQDENDSSIDGEEIIYLGGSSSSNGDADNIKISTNDSTPDVNDYVDITLEIRDDDDDTVEDYTDKVEFLVYYYDNGTYKRTTSSSFFTLSDDEYDFESSDDGEVRLSNWIKFKKDRKYKLVVEDKDDSSIDGEKIFTVGDADDLDTTTSDPDQFAIELLTKDIETNERIDLKVVAITEDNERSINYREKVEFKVQEVDDAGKTNWSTPDNGDYSRYLSTYTFTSSNDGEKSLYDIMKFNREGYYKIIVEDEDDSDIYGASYVFIPDVNYDSSIPGFSSSERNQIRGYYELWATVINRLVALYPELHDDDNWEQDWMDFYEKIEDTVTDRSWKFSSYKSFRNEFDDWIKDTAKLIN